MVKRGYLRCPLAFLIKYEGHPKSCPKGVSARISIPSADDTNQNPHAIESSTNGRVTESLPKLLLDLVRDAAAHGVLLSGVKGRKAQT